MNNKVILGIALVIVILIAGIFITSSKSDIPNSSQSIETNEIPTPPKILDVSLTNNGFVPKTITINKGETVSWINKSNEDGTVNSDPHPTHNLYKFLNLGEFPPGSTVQAIFSETGTFTYHNHLNPSQKGTVIVK